MLQASRKFFLPGGKACCWLATHSTVEPFVKLSFGLSEPNCQERDAKPHQQNSTRKLAHYQLNGTQHAALPSWQLKVAHRIHTAAMQLASSVLAGAIIDLFITKMTYIILAPLPRVLSEESVNWQRHAVAT